MTEELIIHSIHNYFFKVFCDIRDRHFSNVFGYLSQKAKDVQSGYDVSMWWVKCNKIQPENSESPKAGHKIILSSYSNFVLV